MGLLLWTLNLESAVAGTGVLTIAQPGLTGEGYVSLATTGVLPITINTVAAGHASLAFGGTLVTAQPTLLAEAEIVAGIEASGILTIAQPTLAAEGDVSWRIDGTASLSIAQSELTGEGYVSLDVSGAIDASIDQPGLIALSYDCSMSSDIALDWLGVFDWHILADIEVEVHGVAGVAIAVANLDTLVATITAAPVSGVAIQISDVDALSVDITAQPVMGIAITVAEAA